MAGARAVVLDSHADYRMNDRACGIEWLSAPLLLFTKSDRALFLLNFIPFLLLPGLVFSIFTRLGVRARVAWQWMWLLPTGYDFLLQAGSIANDTFPTVYALAAVDFAARAWQSRRAGGFVAFDSGRRAADGSQGQQPAAAAAVGDFDFCRAAAAAPQTGGNRCSSFCLAALVSFLPTAILNFHYLGDWSGLSIEHKGHGHEKSRRRRLGQRAADAFNNFIPPLCPFAGWWNQHALTLLPQFIIAPMVANFESGFHVIGELPIEDAAGIGFGLSVLLLVSFVAARFGKKRGAVDNGNSGFHARHSA